MQTWKDKNYKTKIGINVDEMMNRKQLSRDAEHLFFTEGVV